MVYLSTARAIGLGLTSLELPFAFMIRA